MEEFDLGQSVGNALNGFFDQVSSLVYHNELSQFLRGGSNQSAK
jgi:hypothetical protein